MAVRQIPLTTSTTIQRRSYFNVFLADGISPGLGFNGQQPNISINGSSWDTVGISVLQLIGNNSYYADIDADVITDIGELIETQFQGLGTALCPGDSFVVISDTVTNIIPSIGEIISQSYSSLDEANFYFNNRLGCNKWFNSSDNDKLKALRQATRMIDRLNFTGIKTDPNQLLEFPRYPDVEVPNDIKIANYEIALPLLEGVDINAEVSNLFAESRSLGASKTSWNRKIVPEYIAAGIPSAIAWEYLRPYLVNSRSFTLERI